MSVRLPIQTPEDFVAAACAVLEIERLINDGAASHADREKMLARQRELWHAMEASGYEFDEDDNVVSRSEASTGGDPERKFSPAWDGDDNEACRDATEELLGPCGYDGDPDDLSDEDDEG